MIPQTFISLLIHISNRNTYSIISSNIKQNKRLSNNTMGKIRRPQSLPNSKPLAKIYYLSPFQHKRISLQLEISPIRTRIISIES